MHVILKYWYYLTFDGNREYGQSLPCVSKYSDLNKHLLNTLHYQASLHLPKGLYYEIRGKIPVNYGRDKALAWYHTPMMQIRLNRPTLTFMNEEGYYFIGGYFT